MEKKVIPFLVKPRTFQFPLQEVKQNFREKITFHNNYFFILCVNLSFMLGSLNCFYSQILFCKDSVVNYHVFLYQE